MKKKKTPKRKAKTHDSRKVSRRMAAAKSAARADILQKQVGYLRAELAKARRQIDLARDAVTAAARVEERARRAAEKHGRLAEENRRLRVELSRERKLRKQAEEKREAVIRKEEREERARLEARSDADFFQEAIERRKSETLDQYVKRVGEWMRLHGYANEAWYKVAASTFGMSERDMYTLILYSGGIK